MLFLLCLDPLMTRRPVAYTEQHNEQPEEVSMVSHVLLPSWTDTGYMEIGFRPGKGTTDEVFVTMKSLSCQEKRGNHRYKNFSWRSRWGIKVTTPWAKNTHADSCFCLCQILTDFQNFLCKKAILKDHTTLQVSCCYTILWNISFQKLTDTDFSLRMVWMEQCCSGFDRT